MPSKADYKAISGSYQLHLDSANSIIQRLELDKLPEDVKSLVDQVELLQKLTDVYKKAGE